MRITDIGITKSATSKGTWILHIEIGGMQFTGQFGDFGGFLTAIQEAGTFFAFRAGKISQADAQHNMTRLVKPGSAPGVVAEVGKGKY